MLTVDELKQALPKNLRSNATQEFADKINTIASDPDVAREVRENFLTYATVLTQGKYKTEDYLNAVTYCTFKLMGLSNKAAYMKTFPHRYTNLVAKNTSDKDISAYIAGYHNNKLVNMILEQAYIPIWLINRDVYQKAINKQAYLMANAESELVQTQAANSLLLHLKQPEVKKIELDVRMKDSGGLDELRETMRGLAEKQAQMIADGAGAQTISRVPLRIAPEEEITDVVPALSAPVPYPTGYDRRQGPMKKEPVPALPVTEKEDSRWEQYMSDPAVAANYQGQPKKKLSLFDPLVPEAPKVPEDIKKPTANYARCCDSAIEDCSCSAEDHIFLPTLVDNPMPLKRASLFDDPAGMP